MDAMTQRLWDAEFEKQYPKPDTVPGGTTKECSAFIDASLATWSAAIGRKTELSDVITHIHLSWKCLQENTPWSQWRSECLDRFKAIYQAQPLQALEALRSGNLLID